MLIDKSYTNTNITNKRTNLYQPHFTGVNLSNIIHIPHLAVDKFTKYSKSGLHLDNQINKNALAFLYNKFGKFHKAEILKAYNSCMDANGIINQNAINLLDDLSTPQNVLTKIFQRKNIKNKKYDIEFISSVLETAKDIKHNHTQENLDFVKDLFKNYQAKDKKEYFLFIKNTKDKNGVIAKNSMKNIMDFYKKFPKSNDLSIFLHCLEHVKNSDGTIVWDSLKSFYNLRNAILHKSSSNDPHNIFAKTLSAVKDKQGNISSQFTDKLKNLQEDGLLGEISYLLNSSRKSDGTVDTKVFDKVKNIVIKADLKERIDISKFLEKCKDNKGNIEIAKIQVLEDIVNSRIKSNILNIYDNLLNPDGTISSRGAKLIQTLRKNSHHQIEPDLPKILKLCRDKNGIMDNKKLDAVKKIQSYKPHVNLSDLMKLVMTKSGEINDSKMNSLEKMLHHSKLNNEDAFKTALKIATDKNGSVNFDTLKLFWKIKKNEGSLKGYSDLIPALKDFVTYNHVSSFDQLSLSQKRDLMRKLKKYKTEIQDARFSKYLNIRILPKNDSDYCDTLGRLSHSLGINVKPISATLKSGFFGAMKNMSQHNSEFMKLDFNNHPPILKLSYSVDDFQKDVWNKIKDLSYSERIKTMDYFGFELKFKDNQFIMNGFPSADKPDGRLQRIKDKNVQTAISKITPYVIKFSQNNSVNISNNQQLSKNLTALVKAFPEFLTTIGKVQHPTHDYTLDVHILKVLQGVFKNNEYQKLSDASKKQLQLAALFHDINKSANEVDAYHSANSAFDTYYLLNKLQMAEKDKLKIYHIIKNHSWLSKYNKSKNNGFIAKNLAYELRSDDAFKLVSILTEADLKGVKKQDTFYTKHAKDLVTARKSIEPLVYDLQKTAINLPQTRIPKAHKLNHKSNYISVINKDGIKNSVIYLRHGIDLKKVGFEDNVALDDLNLLVHGLDTKDQAAMLQALGLINSKALLSSSYINYGKGNWRVFRQQGFVLDVSAQDIQAAYWRDFGSGYKKDENTLFSTYLWQNNEQRNYMSNQLKKELNLSDSQYVSLYRKIEDMSISELDIHFPKVAKAYRKVFSNMDVSKRSYGRNYNEVLVNRPRIQAVFCYSQNPENLSYYLRRYAEKNDIPIIVF